MIVGPMGNLALRYLIPSSESGRDNPLHSFVRCLGRCLNSNSSSRLFTGTVYLKKNDSQSITGDNTGDTRVH